MSDFSIGDAVGAGFGLIAKRPLSVLAWMVVYLVLATAPSLAHLSTIQPALSAMMRSMFENAGSGHPWDPGEMRAFTAQMWGDWYMWLAMIGGLLAWAIVSAAIYRSVLEPENKGFASLRFGAQELWLIAVLLVAIILFFLLYLVLVLFCAIAIGVVAAAVHGGALAWLFGFLIFLAAVAVLLWIWVRLSLAGPLTFADRRFRLFESWSLTKGHAWKLFGLAILMILVWIGLQIAIAIVLGGLRFATMGGGNMFDPAANMRDAFAGMTLRNPAFVVLTVLSTIAKTGVFVVMLAPWAVVFRELSPRTSEQAAVF
jgi:hypothetical protein